ncbi:MAG: AAA family ATPase [Chloroflexota bacterium]|nr:AAA family ATPase [Chloroflexota bacterium]MDQ5866226.1 AAA family ATPase [Chloroflexota bacterium]
MTVDDQSDNDQRQTREGANYEAETHRPPRASGGRVFVALSGSTRDTAIRLVQDLASHTQRTYVVDLTGVAGIGKTALLTHLHQSLRDANIYPPARLYIPEHEQRSSYLPARRLDSDHDNLRAYLRLLNSLTEQLPGSFAPMRTLSRHLSAKASTTRNDVAEVSYTFTNCLNASERTAIFIDDFQRASPRPLGDWLLQELVPRLPNSLVVVARTGVSHRLPGDSARVQTVTLDNFLPQETEAFIRQRLGDSRSSRHLAENAHAYTGGHPQAVALVADLALSHGGDPLDLARVLTDPSSDYGARVGKLVDAIVAAVDDQQVRKALKIGWVLRHFDAVLLHHILNVEEGAETTEEDIEEVYGDLVLRLEEYSFTERVDQYYRFHEFIRQEKERQFRVVDPARYHNLHGAAAEYYEAQLLGYEETQNGDTAYQAFHRYEDPDWQENFVEWIYHLGHVGDQETTWLHFAAIYFSAFQWWGRYLEFPFCKHLLGDWLEKQTSEEDQYWGKLLSDFQAAYPTGYQKHNCGDWTRARDCLFEVQRLLGIAGDVAALFEQGLLGTPVDPARRYGDERLKSKRREVRGLTDFFLADSYRYGEREFALAEQYYREAHDLAAGVFDPAPAPVLDEQRWQMAWMLHMLSDLHFEAGALDLAEQEAREAMAVAEEMEDWELLANGHRVLGDVAWQRGDLDGAIQSYNHAIQYSYSFLISPRPPDLYTREFYREMRARTLLRLQELWEHGRREEVERFAASLHSFWMPEVVDGTPDSVEGFLSTGSSDRLLNLLFPREPHDDELNRNDSEFYYEARDILDSINLMTLNK